MIIRRMAHSNERGGLKFLYDAKSGCLGKVLVPSSRRVQGALYLSTNVR